MTTQLAHGNYAVWTVKTRATLMRKMLIKYVTTKPVDGEDGYEDWNTDKDMKALGIIVEALDDNQLQYVKGNTTAAGIWESLCMDHEPREELDLLQLECDWNSVKWDSSCLRLPLPIVLVPYLFT